MAQQIAVSAAKTQTRRTRRGFVFPGALRRNLGTFWHIDADIIQHPPKVRDKERWTFYHGRFGVKANIVGPSIRLKAIEFSPPRRSAMDLHSGRNAEVDNGPVPVDFHPIPISFERPSPS
jgi:hypothetical protein